MKKVELRLNEEYKYQVIKLISTVVLNLANFS